MNQTTFSRNDSLCDDALPSRSALLVDPDACEVESLTRVLEARGLSVFTATTLSSAEKDLGWLSPSYILTELKFQDGDGFELIDIAKCLLPATRIVVFSRQASVKVAVEAVKRGAADVIPKPCSAPFLSALLLGLTETDDECPVALPNPDEIREMHIRHFYQANKGSVSRTARALSMHRRSLQRYMDRHAIR